MSEAAVKTTALVILSGGQDSTTCLFQAIADGHTVEAITFNYGQRHVLEIEAAKKVAELAGVTNHEIVDVPGILKSSSPLTSSNPLEKYDNHEQMEATIGNRRELTFVPMRNALFLTLAANRAEASGVRAMYTGVCAMDNANYDDCRPEFIQAAERYINTALGHDHRNGSEGYISIITPLLMASKSDTVKMAIRLPGCWEALAYSHTSYDGTYPPTDNNHANVLRAQGFKDAGYADPLVVRAWFERLMELPETSNYDGMRVLEKQVGEGEMTWQAAIDRSRIRVIPDEATEGIGAFQDGESVTEGV